MVTRSKQNKKKKQKTKKKLKIKKTTKSAQIYFSYELCKHLALKFDK